MRQDINHAWNRNQRGWANSNDVQNSQAWTRNFFCRQPASRTSPDDKISLIRSVKQARLEAVLICCDKPISLGKLTQYALLADAKETRELLDQLNAMYDFARTPYRVEKLAVGYQLMTRSEYGFWLSRMHDRKQEQTLSESALETLVIIAYRQPLTRAEIEAVRGVQCVELIKVLMEKGLVKIAGQADALGRPYLYATTKKFLEIYGLQNLNELPMGEALRVKDACDTNLPEEMLTSENASEESSDAA